MKRYCNKMLAYDKWAMNKLVVSFEERAVTDEMCLYWYGHIVQSYRHWMMRFHYGTSNVPILEFCPFDEAKSLYGAFLKDFEHYLEQQTEESLQKNIQYQNSKGTTFEQPLEDILIHLFNHATHHRGQIVSRMRALGYEPPVTDYIFYLREGG